MPIEKGVDWGTPGRLTRDAPIAETDAEAAALVPVTTDPIGLSGGDLARTLGVRQPFDPSATNQLLPIDAIEVGLDEAPPILAVAHIRVGSWLYGELIAVMNAAFVGQRNLAPRAHPGDGRVDVVTLRLDMTDRIKARRRMTTGTHVPHPDITVRRSAEGVLEFERPRRVLIDGIRRTRATVISYRVRPEAFVVGV